MAEVAPKPDKRTRSSEQGRQQWPSVRRAYSTGSSRTISALPHKWWSPAEDVTEDMTPIPSHASSLDSNRLPQKEAEAIRLRRAENRREVIVPKDGIKPGMGHTIFRGETHGFRLHVQDDSVPAHRPMDETSGPVTVELWEEIFRFEGAVLKGVLKVECLPDRRRFEAPLLFDFLVEDGKKADPIIDRQCRNRYEVLTKDGDSGKWVRDPESSIPLQIVNDKQGRIYVRAHVLHFSTWCFCENIEMGRQLFHTQRIPWVQRQRHQSLIKNDTDGVYIHIYAMRLSQWIAALESVRVGADAGRFGGNVAFSGNVRETINAAGLMPQMVAIPPQHSHWFEVPRVGAGIWNSRKIVVFIVTESGGQMRLEAVKHLRSKTMLTVALRTENGVVIGPPVASEPGGIFSQLLHVIRSNAKATPDSPRQPSGAGTESSPANDAASGDVSSSTFSVGLETAIVSGKPNIGFCELAESKSDEGSQCGMV